MSKNSNDELYSYLNANESIENELKVSYDRLELIKNYIEIYKKVNNSLENIDGSKEEKDSFIPLGGNIMLPATIKTSDYAIVGLGAGIFKQMKKDDARKKIDEKIKDLYAMQSDILDKISDISVKKLLLK